MDFVLHRHHLGHEHMWLTVWQWRIEQPKFIAFAKRYYEYREGDIVRICSSHHREIHEIYDGIIQRHIASRGVSLREYTWGDAHDLMNQLRQRCRKWLKRQTPGCAEPWPSNGATKRKAKEFDDYLAVARGEVPF